MKKIELEKLINCVMDALCASGLSKCTLKTYRYGAYSSIKTFFAEEGKQFYSSKTVKAFLKNIKKRLENNEISSRHYRKLRKSANLLDEYVTTGALRWKTRDNRSDIKLNNYFNSILSDYEKNVRNRLASGTVKCLKSNALQFLKFLDDKGHINFARISASEIRNFLLHTSPSHRGSMGNVLFSMNTLFRYLNENGITEFKVEAVLQKAARPRKKVLPCFSHEEVESILAQVDTSTAEGKRNYAIIYLASHTGIRMADIVNLRLTDIDWRKNEINIIQIKTGQPIKIPMETDVGNAIADYVLNGRPSTDSHYVFTRTIAPYKKLENRGTGRNILRKYLNSAGIVHLPWDGKGFHALRRSMGTWMLEADVPLSVISQVLGHRKLDSTKQYLSLHYSMLTKCALNLQGLETRREELL
jgi:site-specific recombinase XerD